MKKLLSTVLVLAMALGMLPAAAAAGTTGFSAASLAAGDKVLYAKYSAATTEDGALTEAAWQTNVTLSDGVKFGAVWDSEHLYLGFTGTAAPSAITLNGKSVNRAGKVGAAREICIPLSEAGITIADYDQSTKLSVTMGAATWSGTLVFDSVQGASVNQFPALKTESARVEYDKAADTLHFTSPAELMGSDGTALVRHNGFAGDKSGVYNAAVGENFTIIDPAKPPVAFEFDVRIDKIPTFKRHYTSLVHKEVCPGLYFIVGGKNVNTDGNIANTNTAGMTFGITYMGEELLLSLRATDFKDGDTYSEKLQIPLSIPLGRKPGQQFHLRMNYDAANDTIDIFVDDEFKGRIENAEYDNPFRYKNPTYGATLQVGAYTRSDFLDGGKNEFDITVSNMSIGAQKVMDPATQLEPLVFNTIKGKNETQAAIYHDLELVASVPGPLTIPLTWTSSNPAVIGTDGKLGEVTRDETVTLTAALVSDPSKTKSFTVTVKGPETAFASSANVEASFARPAVTVDGSLTETGWRMGGRILGKNDLLAAEYGFQWNQTHLFAAVDFVDAVGPVALTLNGHALTVENGKLLENGAEVAGSKVAVGSDTVELSVPFSSIGMGSKLTAYDKTLPIHVTVGGIDGPAASLTLTDTVWFHTVNRHNSPAFSAGSSARVSGNNPVTGFQGPTKYENGWRMYDLYNPNGTNPKGVRTYVLYKNPGFDDRTVGTRVEFDFRADSLPVGAGDNTRDVGGAWSNYGISFSMGTKADALKEGWTVVGGIINTANGLYFVLNSPDAPRVKLDRKVGDTFTLATEWTLDNNLKVYVDGVLKGTYSEVAVWKLGVADQSVCFNMVRDPHASAAQSAADNFDVTITNLSAGYIYDTGDVLSQLDFADFAGSNPSADQVTSNLNLFSTMTDGLLDNTYPVTWASSDESIISRTGVVTRPAVGASFATLTATVNGESKSFDLIIPGLNTNNGGVLHVEADLDPAHGAGKSSDELLFTLDENNNSVIAALDKVDKVNLVTLTDGDDRARLSAESLTLWVSSDNVTYTQIRDFKLVHIGRNWYLYGFDTRAQYVKVHYTQYRGEQASFTGAYGTMIAAGYDASLAKGKTTEYTVTNDTTVVYDASLTVPGLTGDLKGLRVFDKDGKLLYHYVDGDTVIVRYPELALGQSAKVYVQQAAAGSIELASKENVYEITYGSRETYVLGKSERWIMSLPAGTKFANGTKLEQETIYSMGYKLNVSTDGGRTWQEHSKVVNVPPFLATPVERIGGSGGWTFDHHTGRMFFNCYWVTSSFNATDITKSYAETMVIASDDGGKTWYLADTLPRDVVNDPQSAYMITYNTGTVLDCYDGAGPNVDIVFSMGSQYNSLGGFCVRVAYTKDAGKTWELSKSVITYKDIALNTENGTSEALIQERDDGVLVLYTRCQDPETDHFGVSYSLDHGVTWTEECVLSKMYTTNTQATIFDMEVNGKIADLSLWSGNTVLGGRSYARSPLNVAVSTNDSETYRNIQNLSFESEMETYALSNFTYTNPFIVKWNDDDAYVTFHDLGDVNRATVSMFVQDFDKWLTRTRGGYDNFEHGTLMGDGWVTVKGTAKVTETNARDKYSMQVAKDTVVTRSVPYLQNGTVSMDLYVPANASFTLELQSAFSSAYADEAMPIGLRVENGKIYMNSSSKVVGTVNTGWNTLVFDLELLQDAAALSVNGGEPVALDVLTKAGDYVTYITVGAKSDVWVDEVLIISELEPVMESTAADKAAADKVVTEIRALDKLSGEEQVSKAQEVLAAYNALTQAQQDLIDRNVVGDATAEFPMVNYYEVLMSYIPTSAPLTFTDVNAGDWFYDAVAYATSNGIMSGYNADKFGPNDTLTRAMVVQVLYNKEGQPALNGLTHSFSDVPADQWFNNAVTWGSDRKVVSGFGGGVFKPNDAVTIEQVAVILRNYSGSPNGNGDLSKVGQHSDWAADALKWAVEQGILDNVPFTNATEQATRAQTAQMLTNYLTK